MTILKGISRGFAAIWIAVKEHPFLALCCFWVAITLVAAADLNAACS